MSIRSNFDPRRADQRVTFQRAARTQLTSGELVDAPWADVKTCWAAVDGDKASEQNVDGGIRSAGGYTVWVRAEIVIENRITQIDRISWVPRPGATAVILNIVSLVDQQLRSRWMPIVCSTGLNAG